MKREPTLGDLLKDLWQAKLFLIFGGVLGLILAVGFLTTAIPHYRASMLIAPAERAAGPDIKALLPDNSSFAVQYLVNTMGSQDSNDFIRFEHMLRGISVATRLLGDKIIVEGIQSAGNFGFQKNEMKIDTPEKILAHLMQEVSIEPVGTTPLRRLVYKHPDKEFANYLLRRLQETADEIISAEIRNKTHSRTVYLEEALLTTDHPDHRRALTSLLMEQEHVRMILAMGEPFAAIIAEPPTAGIKPYWPRISIVLPIFILGGMFVFYVLYSLRRTEKS